MTQSYTPVEWVDETPTEPGTLINKARLDQMQSAHHFADGFEEVDAIPTEDPGTDYHKVVYCTADSTFYRWDGAQWTADIDDDTKRLLEEHEADHSNPHEVTKAQVGLGNADNTSDADKPISTATQAALDQKADDNAVVHLAGAETIDGKKTFTKNPTISGAPPALTLVNTLDTWVSPPSADAYASIGFSDKNNVAVGNVGTVHKTGTGERRTYLSARTSGGSVTAELDVVISSDGSTKYVTAPARAYDPTHTGDVVTIGTLATPLAGKADDNAVVHLSGAETIAGDKTFTGQLIATGQRAYDPANTTDVATIGTLDAYAPMVRTTGAQTIAGSKTFMADGNNTFLLKGETALGAELNIGSAATGSDPLGQIQFVKLPTLAPVAVIESDAAGLLTLSGSTAVTVHSQRAYNTSNTEDVVTIGTLKASTDVVHTSGPETIAGVKTLTDDPVLLKNNGQRYRCKGTGIIRGTKPSAPISAGGFVVQNNDMDTVAGMTHTLNTTGEAYTSWFVRDYNGTNLKEIVIHTEGYATGPSRAYNAGNTTDLATIGTLDAYTPMVRTSGNQTIAGYKKFSGTVSSTRSFDITVNPQTTRNIVYMINQEDTNGVQIFNIWAQQLTDGKINVYLGIRNTDGTQKNVLLGTGN